MPLSNAIVAANRGQAYEDLLAKLFQRAGWSVQRQAKDPDECIDLVAQQGNQKYIVQIKASSEARRDRAVPLLSQAILEAQASARRIPGPAIPVAVLAVDHVSKSLAEHVQAFVERNAPNMAVGLIDASGFRMFRGPCMEWLNSAGSPSRGARPPEKPSSPANLFSDLNQWMLKVLLAKDIPDSMLSAPRKQYENASQLAEAAQVSVMSAFRFVRQLSSEGFLEDNEFLRVVRRDALLERWLAANQERVREIPVRWVIRGSNNQLAVAVHAYVSRLARKPSPNKRAAQGPLSKAPNRICLGLFAAAEALGFKFVHGSLPHLYLERLDREVLAQLGLSMEDAQHQADAFVRIPENAEAIFRAAVERHGVPVADILQVWLDVSHHPARGKDQAKIIAQKALARLLDGKDA
jgi:Restriction endonuclease